MKTFTILSVLFFAISLNAQITINSNDIIGTGKLFEEAYDYTPDASIKPGNAGANQTWDFSALSADDIQSTLTINPDWTPYGVFYPNSNLAFYPTDDSVYIYMENTATELRMLGMYTTVLDSIQLPVIYNPPLVVAAFPVQYQNHKDSDASFSFFAPIVGVPGIDSAKLKMDIFTETDVDAWGTITTPLGTFDALRMLTIEESFDSIWFKAGGFWTLWTTSKDASHSYAWWSDDNATGYVIAEFDYFTNNDSVADVSYLYSTPTQLIDNKQTSSLISIYPNPSDTYINFSYAGEENAEIEVFDNIGKLLLRKTLAAGETTRISVEQYPSGIYFYKLTGSRGMIINQGKFCRK